MHDDFSGPFGEAGPAAGETPAAASPVVVRRRAGVAAVIGVAASAVAIAYLWRAAQSTAALDWALFAAMALVAGYYLASLVDARTPLLVADDLGVRIRLGHEWRGLPWEAIGQVVVHPRTGLLRDGRLVVAPRNLSRALEGLDAKARRHVALNQKMYGAPLAVPIGTTTRISTAGEREVAAEIAALALGRSEVVELDPRTLEILDSADRPSADRPSADRPSADRPSRDHRSADQPSADQPPADQPAGENPDREAGRAARQPFPALRDDTEPQPFPRHEVSEERRSRTCADPAPVPASLGANTAHMRDLDPASAAAGVAQGSVGHLRGALGAIATVVSRVGRGRAHDIDGPAPAAPGSLDAPTDDSTVSPAVAPPLAPSALRTTRPALRAEAMLDTVGNAALAPSHAEAGSVLPEGRELRRPGSVDLVFERVELGDRVRPISALGDPVEPLVIDDYAAEPAYDPVIGPELSAARTRLGLTVDDVAERTRIRPHVIESIEVDDFTPCGGDFYARGHLRTLARILGKDPAPLLEQFEQRYATAPINARRVFEAELATGMTGSMRSTVGGPNWGLLIGVVLTLLLVWGVARLFTADPSATVEIPAPALDSAAGAAPAPAAPSAPERPPAARPVGVRLTASQADSHVVVRDGSGKVVFSGVLVLGERKQLDVVPPVRVIARDGGAVEARVAGQDRGLLGEAGEPARRTFR